MILNRSTSEEFKRALIEFTKDREKFTVTIETESHIGGPYDKIYRRTYTLRGETLEHLDEFQKMVKRSEKALVRYEGEGR